MRPACGCQHPLRTGHRRVPVLTVRMRGAKEEEGPERPRKTGHSASSTGGDGAATARRRRGDGVWRTWASGLRPRSVEPAVGSYARKRPPPPVPPSRKPGRRASEARLNCHHRAARKTAMTFRAIRVFVATSTGATLLVCSFARLLVCSSAPARGRAVRTSSAIRTWRWGRRARLPGRHLLLRGKERAQGIAPLATEGAMALWIGKLQPRR